MTKESRACASLYAAAIGDALGMPTQDMTREAIYASYGKITDFVDAGPGQEIARGMKAGTITDDTEQLLILARLLIEDGHIDIHRFARELEQWQDAMIAKGSQDLLGPSTNAALERLRQGVALEEVGKNGTTNGSAMRIAPVGIAHAPGEGLKQGVVEATILTHNTAVALASAGLVAGAVSAGIDGASRGEAIEYGRELATQLAQAAPGDTDLVERTRWAEELLRKTADIEACLDEEIKTSVDCRESIAAAIALVAVVSDPWEMLLIAARAGGDTDTVASISGAIAGAITGLAELPEAAVKTVRDVNDLHLEEVATELLALRLQK